MENREEAADITTAEQFTPSVRSLIFGSPNHEPTALQTQLLYNYITDEEGKTPTALLREMGKAPEMWWIWPKRHPGFLDWWNTIIEHVFAKHRLNDLYKALHKRGVTHDTQAAKIVIQRFDPRFTERSQADIRGVFAGYDPPAADRSRERQRKVLAKQVESLPDRTHANACDHKGHTELIEGVVEPCPQSTPAIQAQSQSAEHVHDMDSMLEIEPITKVDPPGGGFEE